MGCACGKEVLDVNGKKYVVRGRVGEGGFSYVDLVEEMYSHKLYAVKRINTDTDEDEIKALKEVEYYRSVHHPNVISCIDWSKKGVPSSGMDNCAEVLMVLPFFRRGTLQEDLASRAKRNQRYSQEDVLRLFLEICKGVRALHDSKPFAIAHRDLKPGNVLLADDFQPVIMDLGSAGPARHEIHSSAEAKHFEDMAAQHCSMFYRAPELFHVESHSFLDERTDIWALGCLLYAICFFKSPFETAYEHGGSVALAVVGGNVRIPDDSKYSQDLHDLILSMLTVNAMERPFIDGVIRHVELLLQTPNKEEC